MPLTANQSPKAAIASMALGATRQRRPSAFAPGARRRSQSAASMGERPIVASIHQGSMYDELFSAQARTIVGLVDGSSVLVAR